MDPSVDSLLPFASDRSSAGMLAAPLARRRALQVLGGAGLLALVSGCRSGDGASSASSAAATDAVTTAAGSSTSAPEVATSALASAGAEIPDETAGPFPGDGSNGPNVLTQDGVVRQDIRSSFGASSTVAAGADLAVRLTVVEADTGAPLPGAAVYAWHCDRDGGYSIYAPGLEGENYLRGVQEADDEGVLSFATVFPGTYPGRWPHVHFEVYGSLAEATGGGTPIKTSQLAFPRETCEQVYASGGYEASTANLAPLSIETDGIFADGYDQQLAEMSGAVGTALTASLVVRV